MAAKDENPNEYDDGDFLRASNKLFEAVADLWEAGASENDIMGELDNALENAKQ